MTARACHPVAGDHMTCGINIEDHGQLTPQGFVHPVLNSRGRWVEPPLECVADAAVVHDGDDVEACVECMGRVG